MSQVSPAYVRKEIFWCTFITVLLTVCMILLGGIVKNTGSSLACPDWPRCFGSFFPEMIGPVAIEHSHRLLGALLGILTCISLLFSLRLRHDDPLLHRCCLLAFVMVIIQGIMGGATVLTQITPLYSTIHLALSHLYFAVLIFICLRAMPTLKKKSPHPSRIVNMAGTACVLVFVQILLGAIIRHYGAGPACGLGWQAAFFCQELTTGQLTLWPENFPGRLHMLHRLNGYLLLLALIALSLPVLKYAKRLKWTSLRLLLIGIHFAVTVQVLLGIKVVGSYIAPLAITMHLGFGLLVWALCVVLFLRLKNIRQVRGVA